MKHHLGMPIHHDSNALLPGAALKACARIPAECLGPMVDRFCVTATCANRSLTFPPRPHLRAPSAPLGCRCANRPVIQSP